MSGCVMVQIYSSSANASFLFENNAVEKFCWSRKARQLPQPKLPVAQKRSELRSRPKSRRKPTIKGKVLDLTQTH